MTKKHTVTFLSTAKTYTAYSTSYVKGVVLSVAYAKGSPAISSTATLEITSKDSSGRILGSRTVGSAAFELAPRLAVVNSTNAAIANTAALIPVADELIAVKVSASSATGQAGTFYIYEQL